MNNKFFLLSVVCFSVLLGAGRPARLVAADSDDYDENGVKKSYYWQGAQLNNLSSRLGSTGFEEEQRRAAGGKDSEQYLAKIREQMAQQAKADAQKTAALTYQGQLPGNPIEVTYLSPGARVTLHAGALFDENSATIHAGAMDTLKRLQTVLDTIGQKPLLFVIADTLDDIPQAADVDAERSLVVLSLLEFTGRNSDEGDPTPEPNHPAD